MTDELKQIWEKVDARMGPQRMETEAEHIARDIREGIFPKRSDPIQVPVDPPPAMTPATPPVLYISADTSDLTTRYKATPRMHPRANAWVPKETLDALREALQKIAEITERKEDKYPTDWRQQIEACPECRRYKDHPIQRGICDNHRRPIYAQEDYDRHETRILGYRAKRIAQDALYEHRHSLAALPAPDEGEQDEGEE